MHGILERRRVKLARHAGRPKLFGRCSCGGLAEPGLVVKGVFICSCVQKMMNNVINPLSTCSVNGRGGRAGLQVRCGREAWPLGLRRCRPLQVATAAALGRCSADAYVASGQQRLRLLHSLLLQAAQDGQS